MRYLKLFMAMAAVGWAVTAGAGEALANKATPFKGLYKLETENQRPVEHEAYFLLDADPLGVIWQRYAGTPLPADLEPYRHEASIIAGFTDRDVIFLVLERGAFVGNGYIAIQGGDGEKLELKKRPDGRYDMALSQKGSVTFFLLGVPEEIL